jgi:hypothetical protein
MRQPLTRATRASREPGAPRAHAAGPRPAGRQRLVQPGCGHARYTKGCDSCALAGIYEDHLTRPGITPAERSEVTRLHLAGDKAALFKLWQAWRREDAR